MDGCLKDLGHGVERVDANRTKEVLGGKDFEEGDTRGIKRV